jgi:hypothetical protein
MSASRRLRTRDSVAPCGAEAFHLARPPATLRTGQVVEIPDVGGSGGEGGTPLPIFGKARAPLGFC